MQNEPSSRTDLYVHWPSDPEMVGAVYQALAARRTAYDTLMWQVPALSLSGQAFLFTIALGPGSSPAARLASALLAFILAVISMQLMSKHRYHEELNSRLLEAFEREMGLTTLMGLAFHSPRELRARFPVKANGFTRRSSYRIWMFGLGLFAAASIGVMVATLTFPRLLP